MEKLTDATYSRLILLQAVLIIRYHKNVRQVLKSTIKKPELATMYENCVNASVVLPPGAAGKTEINFGGGMLEEEDEPTLKKPPNFDSSPVDQQELHRNSNSISTSNSIK